MKKKSKKRQIFISLTIVIHEQRPILQRLKTPIDRFLKTIEIRQTRLDQNNKFILKRFIALVFQQIDFEYRCHFEFFLSCFKFLFILIFLSKWECFSLRDTRTTDTVTTVLALLYTHEFTILGAKSNEVGNYIPFDSSVSVLTSIKQGYISLFNIYLVYFYSKFGIFYSFFLNLCQIYYFLHFESEKDYFWVNTQRNYF